MHLKFYLPMCTGCKICQLACSAEHEQVFNPEKARLKIIHEYQDNGLFIAAKFCNLCRECEKACPVEAISCNDKWIVANYEDCTGCGICAEACPQNVIRLNRDGQPIICDLCQGSPKCIEWCPKGVISLEKDGGDL